MTHYQKLFSYLANEHNVVLLGSELHEIAEIIKEVDGFENAVKNAYNAGYEDATCNHINDADNYYNQTYKQII